LIRVGIGYDVHKLGDGDFIVLGGIRIPSDKSLIGHSDADVLIHAIMDALLGAAALKDIGSQFPTTDMKYKNISSLLLLSEVDKMLKQKGFNIGNIDATVIAEKPKLAPHIDDMRRQISQTLHIDLDRVMIKATTNEGLGFIGTGLGIAACATALLND
jgi:2-C-methyl-D-erythritol 2,4-cyclodiphosphate synthase